MKLNIPNFLQKTHRHNIQALVLLCSEIGYINTVWESIMHFQLPNCIISTHVHVLIVKETRVVLYCINITSRLFSPPCMHTCRFLLRLIEVLATNASLDSITVQSCC